MDILFELCIKFRNAIEIAKKNGDFSNNPSKDRMCQFPIDCCDDTCDFFGFYLFYEFGIKTRRLTKEYYKNNLTYRHCVLLLGNGCVIDLTGDQYEGRNKIFIGEQDGFLKNLGRDSIYENYDFKAHNNERMCRDYEAILKYI